MKLYQKLFQEMLVNHEELFNEFKIIHDKFAEDDVKYKVEFNKKGSEVLDVIRNYERRLVGSTERSSYSKFSGNLSDKFWSGIRVLYPKIDFVGVK